jgi:tungstate transport system substrate-binding protein
MRLAVTLLLALGTGCGQAAPRDQTITLATGSTLQDSGILDELTRRFEEQSGIRVKAVVVGTGQALELGRRGDADVLLVHDPDSERRFMAEGHGSVRREVMRNDFVLVGPPADPAGVRHLASIDEAFRKVAQSGSRFISRGDESGTHQREMQIWRRIGVRPAGGSLLLAGSGMAQVLRIASEKQAYTLTDRASFMVLSEELELELLCQGDPLLVNRYSVLIVNPQRHPHVNVAGARRFVDFLLSADTQRFIGEYGKAKHGRPLYQPPADN